MTTPVDRSNSAPPRWLRRFDATRDALRCPHLTVPAWAGAQRDDAVYQVIARMPSMHDRPRSGTILQSLMTLLSPKAVAESAAETATHVQHLLDASLVNSAGEPVDLVGGFTSLLAPSYLHRMLELGGAVTPAELSEFSRDIGVLLGQNPQHDLQAAVQRCAPVVEALSAVAAHWRDGSLPLALSMSRDSEDDLDVVASIALVAAGGQETVSSLSANLIWHIAQDEAARESFCDDPYGFTDEMLRLHPPIEVLARQAVTSCEVGGAAVDPGQLVLMDLRRALRDPDHFPDPDKVRPRRSGDPGLAFGMGAHRCPGRYLARMLAITAAAAVLRRWGDQVTVVDAGGRPDVPVFAGPTRVVVLAPDDATPRSDEREGARVQ